MRRFFKSVFGSHSRATKSMRRQPGRRFRPSMDALENRLVPAVLVNATTLTYQDVDGDAVTVSVTRGTLAEANFTFDGAFGNSGPQQLRVIDLSDAEFQGSDLTITAARGGGGGDGFANVGLIDGRGVDLAEVVVDGDLGAIKGGDVNGSTAALVKLKVQSLGRFGTSTGAPNTVSDFEGAVGKLRVKSDVVGAFFNVDGGAAATLGRVNITGSVLAGSLQNGSTIFSFGDMGPVTIGGDLDSSALDCTNDIASVTIGGSLVGGAVNNAGRIATGSLGQVTIGGNFVGGSAFGAGQISVDALASLTIGGSVLGGAGNESANIFSTGNIGPVTIAGNLEGGSGFSSGEIDARGSLGSVTIGGSVIGGAGGSSAAIFATLGIGPVKITGDLRGGSAADSAAIENGGTLVSLTIGGSLIGGTGPASAAIFPDELGPVKIAGNLQGGSGFGSAEISPLNNVASLIIGGSMIGGAGNFSASVRANDIGAVKITGNFVGGSAAGTANLAGSGSIEADRIASLFIGGSIIAGIDNTSGQFRDNGSIRADDDIGSITVLGSLVGNSTNPVVISARGQRNLPAGANEDVAIASLTVGGRVELTNILAGYRRDLIPLNADAQIGAVSVGGDWVASNLVAGVDDGADNLFGTADDALIAEAGAAANITARIASIAIKGQVLGTVGGADHFGFVAQQLGALSVGGTIIPVTGGVDNLLIGATNDVRAREDV